MFDAEMDSRVRMPGYIYTRSLVDWTSDRTLWTSSRPTVTASAPSHQMQLPRSQLEPTGQRMFAYACYLRVRDHNPRQNLEFSRAAIYGSYVACRQIGQISPAFLEKWPLGRAGFRGKILSPRQPSAMCNSLSGSGALCILGLCRRKTLEHHVIDPSPISLVLWRSCITFIGFYRRAV